ncbi:ATP-binding cassette transporter [Coprinopsis cinerea okayama7|uniref:ATP-binding cassette transporter n=1 Tax=Coprinopsis cinerea (strain Okayama-7 / 130 / ATCC MYA-4618 / FGSC 9003) TaxID=240176 RepID=A8NFD7_COPC7|nr:ATP-binding cassette transporter [Coprinopsis cinerea okayama7\|eukprot:XP_001833258.2 ATP-binding cassette transporter [Coprinopsis cinerea okayama7\
MTDPPLLELSDVTCTIETGQVLFDHLDLVVNEGDIVVLQGRSGTGKTTLLKCIAHLILYEGEIRYRGELARQMGIPNYRTRVLYVPQRPSLLPGGPLTFLKSILSLQSQASARPAHERKSEIRMETTHGRAREITEAWDLDSELWERDWSNLSGGEAQRMLLAIALALDTAEVILLDEPTSALDEETSLLVERYLVDEVASQTGSLKALVWITHSADQGRRVGTSTTSLV